MQELHALKAYSIEFYFWSDAARWLLTFADAARYWQQPVGLSGMAAFRCEEGQKSRSVSQC